MAVNIAAFLSSWLVCLTLSVMVGTEKILGDMCRVKTSRLLVQEKKRKFCVVRSFRFASPQTQ